MSNIYEAYYNSEIGTLKVTGNEDGILSVDFVNENKAVGTKIPDCLKECVRQLDEYFKGTRTGFDLKLIPEGTEFQSRVWKCLMSIPFGKTASYGDIAVAAGNRKASRAVGGANNKNRIAVIIPCHRVIGSSGKLIGYGGGLWRKEWLLEHEKRVAGMECKKGQNG